MLSSIKKTKIALILSLAIGVTACGDKTSQEYIALGEQSIASHDLNLAVIQFKNAVRVEPENALARNALANAYMLQANYINAEKEYDKAIELGVDKLSIVQEYINVKSKLERVEEVYSLAENSASLNDDDYIIVLTYAGITALRENNVSKAQDYFEQAISISESNLFSFVAKGYLHQSRNSFKEGLEQVNLVIEKGSNLSEALLLKGHLLFALKEYDEAAKTFNEYVSRHPKAYYVKFFEVNSLLHSNKVDEADNIITQILKSNNKIPLALQYKGQIELAKGNYEEAKIYSLDAANSGVEFQSAKVIAGLSAFKLNELEQAYTLLQPYENLLPKDHVVIRVLTYLKLKLNDDSDALAILSEIENPTDEDIQLIVGKGYELLKSGQAAGASKLIGNIKADKKAISDSLQVKLNLLKASLGDDHGISLLKEMVEEDPSSIEANIALADAYLNSGESDKALEVALIWQKKFPNSIEAVNLTTELLIKQGEFEQAEEYIERAISLKSDDPYSLMYIANKAYAKQEYNKALTLVEKVLAAEPDNFKALSLMYVIKKENGDVDSALNLIKESFLRNEENIKYRLFYAKNLYTEKRHEEIIELLNDPGFASLSSPVSYWIFLGGSYSYLQQHTKAINTFTEWSRLNPKSRMAWFSKLSIQDQQRDFKGALMTVKSIINAFPNEQEVKVLLPHYQVETKLFDEAQRSLADLTSEQKSLPVVQGIQGKIWFGQQLFEKAYPALLSYYQEVSSPRNAGLVYTSLIKSNNKDQAFAFMEAHIKKYPDDVITKVFYAQLALELDLTIAKRVYKELLSTRKDNINFLANLAWVESEMGNFDSAIELADRALLINAKQPNIIDTLAMAHYSKGNIDKAIQYITQAKELSPENKTIEKHYLTIMKNQG